MHDIPSDKVGVVLKFMLFCQNHFQVVSIKDLKFKKWPKRGKPFLLLTFDDGFCSTFNFFEINFFPPPPTHMFVVSDFLTQDTSLSNLQREEIVFLEDGVVTEKALKKYLKTMPISVGSHSSTHPILASLTNEELEEEIIFSGDRLSEIVGETIDTYAIPFGRMRHVNANAIKKSLKRYFHVFTNVRGVNTVDSIRSRGLVWRQNVDANDSLAMMKFCLLGGFDFIYQHERKSLSSMAKAL